MAKPIEQLINAGINVPFAKSARLNLEHKVSEIERLVDTQSFPITQMLRDLIGDVTEIVDRALHIAQITNGSKGRMISELAGKGYGLLVYLCKVEQIHTFTSNPMCLGLMGLGDERRGNKAVIRRITKFVANPGKRFMLIPVVILFAEQKATHSNFLLLDSENLTIDHFESHIRASYFYGLVVDDVQQFVSNYAAGYRLRTCDEFCPTNGDSIEMVIQGNDKFCRTWAAMFAGFYVRNIDKLHHTFAAMKFTGCYDILMLFQNYLYIHYPAHVMEVQKSAEVNSRLCGHLYRLMAKFVTIPTACRSTKVKTIWASCLTTVRIHLNFRTSRNLLVSIFDMTNDILGCIQITPPHELAKRCIRYLKGFIRNYSLVIITPEKIHEAIRELKRI